MSRVKARTPLRASVRGGFHASRATRAPAPRCGPTMPESSDNSTSPRLVTDSFCVPGSKTKQFRRHCGDVSSKTPIFLDPAIHHRCANCKHVLDTATDWLGGLSWQLFAGTISWIGVCERIVVW